VPDVAADMAAILADALAEGLGVSATYTIAATSATATVTVCMSETGQYLHDESSEKRRREVSAVLLRTAITAPVKGDTIACASGAQTGTWTVIEVSGADAAAWVLRARIDDRTVMGTGRRMS
jgi:hypothetical protein